MKSKKSLTRFHIRVRDDLAPVVRSMMKAGESLTEHPDESEDERRVLREAGASEEMVAMVKPREGVAFTLETFDAGVIALVRRIVYAAGGNDRTPLRGIDVSLAPAQEASP